MNTKRTSFQLILAVACFAGLLAMVGWLLSTPSSSTADVFPFYSPIPPIGDPQIELVKTIDNDNPSVGDEIIYTLTYANVNSGSQAFNVRLYDLLPAGAQFISSNPVADVFTDRALLFTVPSVGPTTDPEQITIRLRVLEGYEQLHNHAMVIADGVTPVHALLQTNVIQPPAWLRLVKTGYSFVLRDGELVYTLMCQNTGATTVNDVTLIDVLPTGLPLVDASLTPDEQALPMLRWSLGDLSPGERRTVIITTTAPASAGVIANTALADARQRVVTQTIFSTQVISEGAILRVSKVGSAPAVYPGDELVYTLQYENAGNQTAENVTLTDTFPSDINVNGANPPSPDLTNQRGVWSLGVLAPGDSGQIVITTTVQGSGGRTLLNVADITGQPDSPSGHVYPGHFELETDVKPLLLYLPIVAKQG